jgi:MBG domain (YGX type)
VGLTIDYQQLNASGQPVHDLGSTAPIAVGNYQVTAAFAGSTDYTSASAATFFTITQATLTVMANSVSKVYGTANPTLSAIISGFVNGDTAGVVSGAASLTTTATAASGVGTYPITAALGTLTAANSFAMQKSF